MKKHIIFMLLITINLQAGEIRDKFVELEELYASGEPSEEYKKKTLDNNLNRALRMALLRDFNLCQYQDASLSNGSIEISDMNPMMYYFKYDQFYGYFLFLNDPSLYTQRPLEERVLALPDAKITHIGDDSCK